MRVSNINGKQNCMIRLVDQVNLGDNNKLRSREGKKLSRKLSFTSRDRSTTLSKATGYEEGDPWIRCAEERESRSA